MRSCVIRMACRLVIVGLVCGAFGAGCAPEEGPHKQSLPESVSNAGDKTADPEDDFNPQRLFPTHFPPVTDFQVITGSEAAGKVADAELVLGVAINGEARAYPLNMITGPDREFVNDRLGGVEIAPTWCNLCHNGIVYVRKVDGKTLTLCCSGMLWKGNVLMLDLETRSLWSQLMGRAVRGPLRGTTLEVIPSLLTDWKTWREKHAQTTVIVVSRSTEDFRREFYSQPAEFLVGLATGRAARAWPFDQLLKQSIVNDHFQEDPVLVVFGPSASTAVLWSRRVDGRELEFIHKGGRLVDTHTESEWDAITGVAVAGKLQGLQLRQLPGTVSYTRVWLDFYPQTEFWLAE